jgi:LacI family transcriptional regulator
MKLRAKDIAASLGISPTTVSLVLNNKPGISEATRNRVFEAISQTGYQDYRQQTQKQTVIKLVVCKKHGSIVADTPFFAQLIEGIEMRSRHHGFHINIVHLSMSESVGEQLRNIVAPGCCGLLLLATELFESDLGAVSALGLPFVVLDSYFDNMNFDTVVINNMQGSYAATKHLAAFGHKKIGYLGSSVVINNFIERRDGFLKAMRVCGLQVDDEYHFLVDSTTEGAYRDMNAHLERYKDKRDFKATAFYCDNDIIAAACMKAFRAHNFVIPDDVSLIGFDDMPFCALTEPPLSTMMVPKLQMGALAVDRLADKITNQSDEFIKIEVGARLIERESVRRL